MLLKTMNPDQIIYRGIIDREKKKKRGPRAGNWGTLIFRR